MMRPIGSSAGSSERGSAGAVSLLGELLVADGPGEDDGGRRVINPRLCHVPQGDFDGLPIVCSGVRNSNPWNITIPVFWVGFSGCVSRF